MSAKARTDATLRRLQFGAFAVGGTALAAGALGSLARPDLFFRFYLVAFLICLGPALGSLGLLFLHQLTGGAWGHAIRRPLEASARTVPFVALAFIPLLFGLREVYAWASPGPVAEDAASLQNTAYLNIPFFLVRAGLYFAIWIALAFALSRFSRRRDRGREDPEGRSLKRVSGPALILLGLSISFAAIDWAMSLEPRWYSTIYGMVVIVGQLLAALALALLVDAWAAGHQPGDRMLTRSHFNDLGNLCLMFVMLWAYLAFCEYLIIWSGNLPEEVPWFLHRTTGGWGRVALLLIAVHFALPFFVLLSHKAKRSRVAMGRIAVVLLVAQAIDVYWLVVPAFPAPGTGVGWRGLLVPLGLVGLWTGLFAKQLRRGPLVTLPLPPKEAAVPAGGEA